MKNKRLITDLAHPNSLRTRAGRPEYTTEPGISRRHAEGRGTGNGENYIPWFFVRDFHSSGFRRMVWSPRLQRVIHLFSDLEYRIFLWLEANERYTEIRECFPLNRHITVSLADGLGLRHPAAFGVNVVMTSDFFLKVVNGSATTYLAIAVKYAKDLRNPRVQEKLRLEEEYHKKQGHAFQVMTEESVSDTEFQNLRLVRGALRLGAMSRHSKEQLDLIEAILRQELARSTIGEACVQTDVVLALPPASSFQALRYFIATRRWKVDLRNPITLDAVLKLEVS